MRRPGRPPRNVCTIIKILPAPMAPHSVHAPAAGKVEALAGDEPGIAGRQEQYGMRRFFAAAEAPDRDGLLQAGPLLLGHGLHLRLEERGGDAIDGDDVY